MNLPGKRTIPVACALAAMVFLYMLLWGKLFVFSPVALGFERQEFANTVFYTQDGAAFEEYELVDGLLSGVEDFHKLSFTEKPKIYVFRDSTSYRRRSISRARFCAFPNSSVVIAPWSVEEARAGEISLAIYLTHELSHTLLFQHMGGVQAYRYPPWLMEGLAVYSSNQMGTTWYPSREETYALMRQGNFMPPDYFKTGKEDDVELDVPYRITFMYSEFACIVEYLIDTGGKDRFLAYMNALFDDNNHDKVFEEQYGMAFDDMLTAFKEHVNQSGG